jgi:hypothetical protein
MSVWARKRGFCPVMRAAGWSQVATRAGCGDGGAAGVEEACVATQHSQRCACPSFFWDSVQSCVLSSCWAALSSDLTTLVRRRAVRGACVHASTCCDASVLDYTSTLASLLQTQPCVRGASSAAGVRLHQHQRQERCSASWAVCRAEDPAVSRVLLASVMRRARALRAAALLVTTCLGEVVSPVGSCLTAA